MTETENDVCDVVALAFTTVAACMLGAIIGGYAARELFGTEVKGIER